VEFGGCIPDDLKVLPQFVAWREEFRDGKLAKVPVDAKTGHKAAVDRPDTWASFAVALAAVSWNGNRGIGFVLTAADLYTVIDLDKCRNPETGEIEAWAWKIIRQLYSFTEISPSGAGVHIWVRGKLPPGGRRKGRFEAYSDKRYLTLTGLHLEGTPATIEARQAELETLHREIFGQEKKETPKPGPSPNQELSDRMVIEKACAARNGEKFSRLWAGNWQADYPSQSEADLALCEHLSFWTARDSARIDRLFRQSGLMRGKWERQDYRERTIDKAIENTAACYTPGGNGTGKSKASDAKAQPRQEAPKPEPVTGSHNLTDMGNAARLVALHGRDLLYSYKWGSWLVWDGMRWLKDDGDEIERRAKDVARSIYAEASRVEDKDLRKAIADHAKKTEGEAKRRAMIASAQCELPVNIEDLDRDPWLLNVLNGTLNLKTGKLHPHRREDRTTKLAPVAFDPEAEAPTWWKFLRRIMGDNLDLINFLQKAVGYALTGSTREQCLFILYGLGENGKSTFLETIKELLGDYAQDTNTETFMLKKNQTIPNDIAALRGARFVKAVEVEGNRRMAEVLIKQMTGGDTLSARFLHQEFFSFKPAFKIFLGVNHKPMIRGTDWAIWRRIRLIPFTVQIPKIEQDKDLPEKLKAELPGILTWALEGCLAWQDDGLDPPEEVEKATQEYREEMDALGEWLAECCIVAPGASDPAKDLYNSYVEWAEANGEKRPLSQRIFGGSLRERGFQQGKSTGGARLWYGIRLKG
jgi:putative DNA primase/helicase